MAKIQTKEELENIARMERAYSPENIRASNRALKLRVLKKRIADIDTWRNEKLRELQEVKTYGDK
jgi:hypothetical protein